MKTLILTIFATIILGVSAGTFGQKADRFDIISFKTPVGWQKQASQNAIQLGGERDGAACLVTLFKAVPGSTDAKVNFDAAWKTIVEELVKVSGKPQMQPSASVNGWTSQSGIAGYEIDGKKGVVLLVTLTGGGKMVNIVVLTDSDAFQTEVTELLGSIELPKIDPQKTLTPEEPVQTTRSGRKSNFKFTETNFDDGWTGTEREDWVELSKGNIRVLIHYEREGTVFPADPEPLTNAAWNMLVSPRYRDLKNYRTAYIATSNRPYLGMGYATENASGKQVFILLFWQGNGGWLEFIAPDKGAFTHQYGFDPEAIRYDSNEDLLKPLNEMRNLNKFAVSLSDLPGTWANSSGSYGHYYSTATGNYAGAIGASTSDTFVFGPNNTFRHDYLGVGGMMGSNAQSVSQGRDSGTFTVSNWEITLTGRNGKPVSYFAQFEAVRGGRILHLQNKQASALKFHLYRQR